MSRGLVVLTGVGAALLAFWFAAANGSQRVQIRLGIVTLDSVSVPALVFSAALLGMISVVLVGLRADLRTRRMLRRYKEILQKDE
ncbi:MAG: hypothetical protein ABFS14_00170 [Gemmatimonadota bacterium]